MKLLKQLIETDEFSNEKRKSSYNDNYRAFKAAIHEKDLLKRQIDYKTSDKDNTRNDRVIRKAKLATLQAIQYAIEGLKPYANEKIVDSLFTAPSIEAHDMLTFLANLSQINVGVKSWQARFGDSTIKVLINEFRRHLKHIKI